MECTSGLVNAERVYVAFKEIREEKGGKPAVTEFRSRMHDWNETTVPSLQFLALFSSQIACFEILASLKQR